MRGVGLYACPAGCGGPQCRMRPLGVLCAAGAVFAQPAPKWALFPPTVRMTPLRGWHVAASIPWAGWGSACAEHHDTAPSSWQDGCQPVTQQRDWQLSMGGLETFCGELSFGSKRGCEKDALMQKLFPLG